MGSTWVIVSMQTKPCPLDRKGKVDLPTVSGISSLGSSHGVGTLYPGL